LFAFVFPFGVLSFARIKQTGQTKNQGKQTKNKQTNKKNKMQGKKKKIKCARLCVCVS
jgi:hypothetical protein